MLKVVKSFLPLAITVTCLSGLIYTVVQQNFRQSANDPQIQMAEDAVAALGMGKKASEVVGSNKVDMAKSLAPFLIVYDKGEIIASSASLDGQDPNLPAGVLDYVNQNGEDKFTWQPRQGVRVAAVAERVGSQGAVLAGRSLREIEIRIDNLTQMVAAGWVATMVVSLIAVVILRGNL